MGRTALWPWECHGETGGRKFAAVVSLIAVWAIFVERSPAQEVRPGAQKAAPAPLARHVPLRDLLFYLEFDGLNAHADAWKKTAACKLLNDTQLGAIVEDLALQAIGLVQEKIPREKRLSGGEVVGLLKQIARDGFALAVSRKERDDLRVVAVLRRGDRPEVRALLEQADAAGRREGAEGKANLYRFDASGRTLYRLGEHAVWLVDKGDLILTGTSSADVLLAVENGTQQAAAGHPLLATLAKTDDALLPAAIGFIDMAALAADEIGPGLDGLKGIGLQWGFQEDALVTRLRVMAPAPRRGLLVLLDQPTFGINSLPPLPARLTHLSVLSIDLAKAHDQIEAVMKIADRPSPADPPSVGILARHGIELRKDLLGYIGPRLVFYALAPGGEDTATAASMLMSQVAGLTLTAQVRDEAAASRGVESLIKSFNPILREQLRAIPRNRFAPALAFLKFQRVPGFRFAYTIDLPPDVLAPPYATMLRPTVMLDRRELMVSASTSAPEQALAGGPRWQPAGAFVPLVNKLPAAMVYMTLSDPRASTSVFVRILPILVRQINAEIAMSQRSLGKVAADVSVRLDPDAIPPADELNRLLFPSLTTLVVDHEGALLTHREAIPTLTSPVMASALAARLVLEIESSREVTRRARCASNLQQIAVAMRNHHHAAKNTFPMPAIMSAKGEPLLSWRVAILPYLGQEELYDKFKHEEPWDSQHNKALLKEMPPIFLCPDRGRAEPFTTPYRVFVGNGALFEKNRDIAFADIADGNPQTVMVVEAKQAVPWTKPDDLPFDPAAVLSLHGAGSPHPGGFNAAMANGAVRFIKNTIAPNLFRALITRAGGEVIGAGAF